MYTIKQASALTGLSADTLRAWERRYRLPPPRRSEGGYRLYDDASLAIYQRMQRLIEQGWAPRQAADAARAEPADPATGELPPRLEPEAFVAEVIAGRLGGDELGAALRVAMATLSPAEFADEWMLPMLGALGRGWQEGALSVAQEHEVAAALMRRLSIGFEEAAAPGETPPVLVGLLPGCTHEVALLAFAVLARSAGVAVLYLGANVPLESWVSETRRVGAAAIVTAVHSDEDVAAAGDLLDALGGVERRPQVFVGGSRQAELSGRGTPLGHGLAPAAALVRSSLDPLPAG